MIEKSNSIMVKLSEDKIPAELVLDLISHFNTNNHPEGFLFNDEEQLECFAADVLASTLSAHFGSETIVEHEPYNTIGTGGSTCPVSH